MQKVEKFVCIYNNHSVNWIVSSHQVACLGHVIRLFPEIKVGKLLSSSEPCVYCETEQTTIEKLEQELAEAQKATKHYETLYETLTEESTHREDVLIEHAQSLEKLLRDVLKTGDYCIMDMQATHDQLEEKLELLLLGPDFSHV